MTTLIVNGLDTPNKRQLKNLRQNISTLNQLMYERNNTVWPNGVYSRKAAFENQSNSSIEENTGEKPYECLNRGRKNI